MSPRPIMDAGPGINFFSLNKERLLFGVLGPLSIPEVVQQEIIRKARQDQRFLAAERVLNKVPERLLEVLSDDATDEFIAVVQRLTGMPFEQRVRTRRDLGETMVIAHAVLAAECGENVMILIDDGGGRQLAGSEQRRLRRIQAKGCPVGRLELISTLTVLKKAAGGEQIPDRAAMRGLYERLRMLDDGLAPLESTGLMHLPCWFERSD